MTRDEFIEQLRGFLYELPPDEREAALQFYQEYFDDAGPENEQRIIQELGSPSQLAAQILTDCTERYAPPAYGGSFRYAPRRKRFPWWMIVTLVILSPAILPLLLALSIVAVTLLAVVFILIVVFVVVVIALVVAGIAGIIGIPFFFSVPFYGPVRIGLAVICLGLGLLLAVPCIYLITRGVPSICHWLGGLFQRRR